jgi:thiol-disulfide isomerase/thioredoxin
MSEPASTETGGRLRQNKWSALVLVAMLATAPLFFQKAQEWIEPVVTTQPLMTVHDASLALGDVPFETPDGRSHSLADYTGQYVLVNIWATWCPPCRKEMPSLEKLQTFFSGNKTFRVVALSVDKVSFEQLRAFYSVLGITTMELYRGEQDSIMQAFGIRGFPTTFLIGPDGKEIARLVGPTLWNDTKVLEQVKQLISDPNAALGGMN